ncbi:MAG TPA: hypothetical protein PLL48_00830 [Novosphingobium sp.]|jgi:hypothetical protein|nr:hypothetical protein [Novosphingobium sp.]
MLALPSLLLAASLAPVVTAESAAPPPGRAVTVVRAQAEILRAERAQPRPGRGGLERKVARGADGQVQLEFE